MWVVTKDLDLGLRAKDRVGKYWVTAHCWFWSFNRENIFCLALLTTVNNVFEIRSHGGPPEGAGLWLSMGFVDSKTNPWMNPCLLALAPLRQSSVVSHSTEPSSTKKADVIDLTLDSSSSDDDDDEEDTVPPLKKHCVYISKNEEMHAKGWASPSVLIDRPAFTFP